MFAAANALTSGGGFAVPYARNVVAAEALVVCSAGLGLVTDLWPVADAALDTLFVPGGQGVDAAASDPISLNWVRRRGRDARRVASVCTGAFVLVSWGIAA